MPTWKQATDWLLQRQAEQDEGFRRDLHRGSVLSLRAVGALELAVPALMLAAGLSLLPIPSGVWQASAPNLYFMGLGAGTLALSTTPLGRRWARGWTLLSIWSSVVIMLWSALRLGLHMESIPHHLRGYIVLVLFGVAAAVPVTPAQALALGIAICGLLFGSQRLAPESFAAAGLELPVGEQAFVLLLTLLCAVLAGSVYRQRYVGYCNHQDALHSSEKLRQAENQLLVSENAAMMGRVAAALSHELNSPIGALASSVDILANVAKKMAAGGDPQRLQSVLEEAVCSGHESAKRLRAIVSRMQRFTNLDRAEVQSADLNEILRDVIAMAVADRPDVAKIAFQEGDVPRFPCRPQQMSAVFSNLLHNALDAVGPDGEVQLRTHAGAGQIEVLVADNGKGIPEEQLRTLFDPAAFHSTHGRMAAGNWSLFSCRQIIAEHRGDISVTSSPQGTTVRVTLPVSR